MFETYVVFGLILGGWPAAKVFWMFMKSENAVVKAGLFVTLAVLLFPICTFMGSALRYGSEYSDRMGILAVIFAVFFAGSFLKNWPNFPKRKKVAEKKKFSSQRKTVQA